MHRARLILRLVVILRFSLLLDLYVRPPHPRRWSRRQIQFRLSFGLRLILLLWADIADAARCAAADWRGPSRTDRSGRSGAPVRPVDRSRPCLGHAGLRRDHSHHGREKVGPDIDQPSLTLHPLQEGAKSYDKRMVTCQMPQTSPCARPSTPNDYPYYRISVGAWTPRTANPDARTETTPWTMARRAFVISASSLIMKRKWGKSRPFVQSA